MLGSNPYLFSVASFTIRVAAWLASSSNGRRVSQGMSSIGWSSSFCLEMLNNWDSGCQSAVRDCQYLEYPPLVKRGYEVSSSWGDLPFSHADSFPQAGADCYSCGFQTAPLPACLFGWYRF